MQNCFIALWVGRRPDDLLSNGLQNVQDMAVTGIGRTFLMHMVFKKWLIKSSLMQWINRRVNECFQILEETFINVATATHGTWN